MKLNSSKKPEGDYKDRWDIVCKKCWWSGPMYELAWTEGKGIVCPVCHEQIRYV